MFKYITETALFLVEDLTEYDNIWVEQVDQSNDELVSVYVEYTLGGENVLVKVNFIENDDAYVLKGIKEVRV